jgi:hypothetical protein
MLCRLESMWMPNFKFLFFTHFILGLPFCLLVLYYQRYIAHTAVEDCFACVMFNGFLATPCWLIILTESLYCLPMSSLLNTPSNDKCVLFFHHGKAEFHYLTVTKLQRFVTKKKGTKQTA